MIVSKKCVTMDIAYFSNHSVEECVTMDVAYFCNHSVEECVTMDVAYFCNHCIEECVTMDITYFSYLSVEECVTNDIAYFSYHSVEECVTMDIAYFSNHSVEECVTNDIIQLLTNEALDMMWCRPENIYIDRGEAKVNMGILWSISHHIQCLISQYLFYYITFRERCTGIIAPGKILNLYTSFGKVKHIAESMQT